MSDTSSKQAADFPSQQRWAKPSEWEAHRERITELYREQGLHLDEVMTTMAEEHEFHAK